MRRPPGVYLLASLLALAACDKGSKRLAGRWHGTRAEGVTTDSVAAANTFAGKMQIEVTGDVIVVTTVNGKLTGHYRTVREDKDKVVIATTAEKDASAEEETFTFVDPKTMRWAVADGKSIVFAKE